LEDLSSIVLGELLTTGDEIEQLTACSVLQDHEDFGLRVNELEELNGMWVVKAPQNLQLTLYFLENAELADFLLI
jgi:hypothetical protein